MESFVGFDNNVQVHLTPEEYEELKKKFAPLSEVQPKPFIPKGVLIGTPVLADILIEMFGKEIGREIPSEMRAFGIDLLMHLQKKTSKLQATGSDLYADAKAHYPEAFDKKAKDKRKKGGRTKEDKLPPKVAAHAKDDTMGIEKLDGIRAGSALDDLLLASSCRSTK